MSDWVIDRVIVVEHQVSISVSSTMAHIGYFILFWSVLDLLVESQKIGKQISTINLSNKPCQCSGFVLFCLHMLIKEIPVLVWK